ncbi:putative membrane protein [Candidatus Phytoplasma solani]|uniref:hypothetical protein n=1 Tax=Candidatus Phytoplasma solani TaxID=69896 RepID=UPI0032DA9658
MLSILFGILSWNKYDKNISYDAPFYLLMAMSITSFLCCCMMMKKFIKDNIVVKEMIEFLSNMDKNIDNRKITLEEAKNISQIINRWSNSFRN